MRSALSALAFLVLAQSALALALPAPPSSNHLIPRAGNGNEAQTSLYSELAKGQKLQAQAEEILKKMNAAKDEGSGKTTPTRESTPPGPFSKLEALQEQYNKKVGEVEEQIEATERLVSNQEEKQAEKQAIRKLKAKLEQDKLRDPFSV